jgi:hypothetical protein
VAVPRRRGNESCSAAVRGGTFSSQRPGHFGRTSTSVVPTNWSGTNARVVRNERRVETASRPLDR